MLNSAETITGGNGSRVGFVLVNENMYFYVEKDWMDDIACLAS